MSASVISQVEDCIVATLKTTFGARLKTVETVPAALSVDELADRLRLAPAAYVGFLGGETDSNDAAIVLNAKFAVYALTENAGGEKARRRGDATAIGAYDIIEIAGPLIDSMTLTASEPTAPIDGAGTPNLDEVANLWAEQLDKLGVSLYAAIFSVKITLPREIPIDARLAPFITFNAQYDIPPQQPHASPLPAATATVDGEDEVTLDQ